MNKIELYPKVMVYRDLIKDVPKVFKAITDSHDNSGENYFNPWTDWSKFGIYASVKGDHEIVGRLGSDPIFDNEYNMVQEVENAYRMAIDDYVKTYDIQLPENSRLNSSSFCRYHEGVDVLENDLTMQYHTDYKQSEREMPGNHFFITCTTYINDNYTGGEIEFYVDGKFITHKPVAGDIMVFPSVEPYYHGVKTITSGYKYLIRNFITYRYPGSKEWLDNQIEFGAVRWAKMEADRIEKARFNGNIIIKNGEVISGPGMESM
jgi:hypothetical protein